MAHDRLRPWIIAGFLTVAAAIGGCGSSIDMPGVLIHRLGYEKADPKVDVEEAVASCSIEGRPAQYSKVGLSINLLAFGGSNKRTSMGVMHVIARENSDGSIVNVIADDSQSAQVADLRRQWTESWGCKLP
jgi:hypothetical protein